MKRSDISLIWGAVFLLLIYGAGTALLLTWGITHTTINQTPDTFLFLPQNSITIPTPLSTILELYTSPLEVLVILMYLLPIVEYIYFIVKTNTLSHIPSQNIGVVLYLCLGIFLPAVLYCCAGQLISHMDLDLQLLAGIKAHFNHMLGSSALASLAVSITYIIDIVNTYKSSSKE